MSRETSHSSFHHRNNDGIYENKIIEVSTGDRRRGHRSIETSQSYSCNRGVYHINDNGRGGYSSQETSHYYIAIVEFIILVLMVKVDLGLKRPSTIPLEIMEQKLMLTEEVDIVLRPETFHPLTHVTVIDFGVHQFLLVLLTKIFMVMRE